MIKIIVVLILSININAFDVFNVCHSINDIDLRRDCLRISRGKYFDHRALRVCLSFNTDLDRRDCVEVIADKIYRKKETLSCMMENDLSFRFFCMQVSGKTI